MATFLLRTQCLYNIASIWNFKVLNHRNKLDGYLLVPDLSSAPLVWQRFTAHHSRTLLRPAFTKESTQWSFVGQNFILKEGEGLQLQCLILYPCYLANSSRN